MSYQHEAGLREQIGDLQRQLAEAKALLAVRIQESNEWEALARDRQEEIEAMRPLAEWARHHPQFPRQYPVAHSVRKQP